MKRFLTNLTILLRTARSFFCGASSQDIGCDYRTQELLTYDRGGLDREAGR